MSKKRGSTSFDGTKELSSSKKFHSRKQSVNEEGQETTLEGKLTRLILQKFSSQTFRQVVHSSKIVYNDAPEVDGKDWRNCIREIANIAAHSMSTSSYLLTLVTSFSKYLQARAKQGSPTSSQPDSERKYFTAVVGQITSFKEDVAERHRQLVKLVTKATKTSNMQVSGLFEFAKKIDDSSKNELEAQSKFVKAVLAELGVNATVNKY
jgi:hypothetical protein